jgi:hypothetical protein
MQIICYSLVYRKTLPTAGIQLEVAALGDKPGIVWL